MKIIFSLFVIVILFNGCTGMKDTFILVSPDRSISVEVSFQTDEIIPQDAKQLVYSITFNNRTVVTHSPLSLVFRNMPMLGFGLTVTGSDRKNVNESWERVWGKRTIVKNNYNQLALMIVYESALQVLCDSPFNYRNSPAGLDFLKIVPTTWDDTRVINADIGNYISIARQSGKEWFVASITDWDQRELKIPLDFLEPGRKFAAKIWQDGEDADTNPASLKSENLAVTSQTIVTAKLAKGGGHIMHISTAD